MAQPIIEQIRDDIVTTLAGVPNQTGVFVLKRIPRPGAADEFAAKDYNILLVQGDLDPVDDEAEMFEEWTVTFFVSCFVRPSDSSTTPIDQTKNIFAADVTKTLLADAQRSNLALNSEVVGWEQFVFGEGAYDGITVVYRVHFRHDWDDPYT